MASEGQKTGEGSGTAVPAPPADAYPRLRHIEITNYKALDHLVLDIPAPTMPGDPDIFVVGSKNGLGKTSLLECCALAQLNRWDFERINGFLFYARYMRKDLATLFWNTHAPLGIKAHHSDGKISSLKWAAKAISPNPQIVGLDLSSDEANQPSVLSNQLFGISPDAIVTPRLIFFNSYRKVQEGPINSQAILTEQYARGVHYVKQKAAHLLLASVGLIEGDSEGTAEKHLERLNDLLTSFAGGRLDKKFRPVGKDLLDLRIVTPRGTTFSFDGLSSGQKEIVTTLFLIWNETLAHPALVLIDEPELHLNAEWQREFLRHLLALAPKNQYILATHSEDIFASVSEERRVLLEASHG